jgi:hypothetical protein
MEKSLFRSITRRISFLLISLILKWFPINGWLDHRNFLTEPFKVVLTEARAKVYFPSIPFSEMIGKQIVYDDSVVTTVSGIVKIRAPTTILFSKNLFRNLPYRPTD